ncbi:MAG: hypothetical protein JWP65_3911 [Ramlibacter sp.]|uniref:DUF2339 domain-containing protein n=1 Tax=Ramlibacter sp. TaxID=1917967 RepID=UPI00260AFA5A|nr:DUF2339 domain-containing protein [Ramlibacter sp.]MDB5753490.1 hypothetical protein [Ramlibacter sp.]
MLVWGAVWGAILGLLWPGSSEEVAVVFGAVLGLAAGWSLRRAIRKEITGGVTVAAPRAVVAPPPAAQPQPQPQAVATPAGASTPAPARARPATPAASGLATTLVRRAREWLFGGNTVVRMGVLVLFVGLAFLARYAVENALLPPQLRLAAIAAAGIALFVFGLRMRRHHPDKLGYSLTLQGAGVAVLYLAVFAAFRLYHFLPTGAAFTALGLVCLFCAAIALAQNALPLAFIGFAGGFAAPVLVSTGQGSHVALFSYYLLLGLAIAGVAWAKAWRPLNLLGFFATFGVATAWGVLRYRPEELASTLPLLVAFFAVYLTASLFYALRHGQGARRAVDATLVFGTPIVAFGLLVGLVREIPYAAAFAALALAALYLALGWWLVKRRRGDTVVNRWLAECFLALALGLVTIAVPLALDGRWTSAAWAVEGAAVFWMGRRQSRWLPRAAGLALQAVAAALFLDAPSLNAGGGLPLANPVVLGATMLAGAALAIAWWSRQPLADAADGASPRHFGALQAQLSPVLFWVGFLWWQTALGAEIGRFTVDAQGAVAFTFEQGQRVLLHIAGWVLSAFALHRLALPRRAQPWRIAATPAWLALPVLLLAAVWAMAVQDHVFRSGGWLLWPPAIALHLVMLRRLDQGAPQAWWRWVHAGGVWLLVLLAANLLVFAIDRARLWQTAWATVILLVAGSSVLLALARRRWFEAPAGSLRWPLDRFAGAYLWRAPAPLAVALALGALLVALQSSGAARPLPFLPLLNPTDLAVALALGACALWLLRLRRSTLALAKTMRGIMAPAVLVGVAFTAINTVWLRVAHHYFAVPWDASALFASFVVQAGYSILWTLIALVLMVGAHRRALRTPWMLGAGLLGLTVLKLFVIDLSNRGGSERIVVFIAVGLLMLVVGWFAPLPPAARKDPPQPGLQEAAP